MPFQQETLINCPYCGEIIEVLVDESAGEQNYYEDCSVCCAPILFAVLESESGKLRVEALRDDE